MQRKAPQHAAGIKSLPVNKPDPKILQDFLALKFALSRRTAKAMIDGRNVWVNRKCVWIARFELRTGDIVEIPDAVVSGAMRQKQQRVPGAECIVPGANKEATSGHGALSTKHQALSTGTRHVRVLWQDESFLVADKPAGIVSCDDPKSAEAILRVQENIPTLEAVHRLDRDTTGCLLFAKNHAAFLAAVEVFKTHSVTKIYNAVVAGQFKFVHQRIDTPLDGEEALSLVTREAASADASFLRIRIETGRTNQIRRHLASIRFPIVGDRVFGLKNARDPRLMAVPRQMLHASTLELPHPTIAHATIKVHSPLPADFRGTLKLFGMNKRG